MSDTASLSLKHSHGDFKVIFKILELLPCAELIGVSGPTYLILGSRGFGLLWWWLESLERLPSKVTALPFTSEDRSEPLHSYLIMNIL